MKEHGFVDNKGEAVKTNKERQPNTERSETNQERPVKVSDDDKCLSKSATTTRVCAPPRQQLSSGRTAAAPLTKNLEVIRANMLKDSSYLHTT